MEDHKIALKGSPQQESGTKEMSMEVSGEETNQAGSPEQEAREN